MTEHIGEIERRLNAYLIEKDTIQKKKILDELHMFTYLQCRAKILQRLRVPIHPFCNVRFYEVFGPDSIKAETLRNGYKAVAEFGNDELTKMKFDERPLADRMTTYTKFPFRFDELNHIILDDQSVVHFHNYLWKLFSVIVANLEALKDITNIQKAEGVDNMETEARGLLVTIQRNFYHLTNLVNKSPTFRRHISNPAIQTWLVEQGKLNIPNVDRAQITKVRMSTLFECFVFRPWVSGRWERVYMY